MIPPASNRLHKIYQNEIAYMEFKIMQENKGTD